MPFLSFSIFDTYFTKFACFLLHFYVRNKFTILGSALVKNQIIALGIQKSKIFVCVRSFFNLLLQTSI
jgi:hypothetical protein